jgi:hydrogenase small subunit
MAFATVTKDPVDELDVLWITAGLGCDGDTIAMAAATQPSIEDVLLGQVPWIPRVNIHNPFYALANCGDFLKPFHQGAKGKMEHFILVRATELRWGTDPKTGQPRRKPMRSKTQPGI